MRLELNGEDKTGFDDQHEKVNRSIRKEKRHNEGGAEEGKNPNCEEVRNMIVLRSMQYRNEKPGRFTKWKRSCIRMEQLQEAQL